MLSGSAGSHGDTTTHQFSFEEETSLGKELDWMMPDFGSSKLSISEMSHSRTNPDQSTKPPEDLEIEATPIVQAAICKNDSTESTGTEASSAAGASTESASSKATSEGLAVEEPELVAVAAGIQAVVVKQDDAPPPPPVVEEGGEVEGGVVDAENSGFDQSHHHYDSITFSYAALKSTVPDDPVVVESTSATAAAAVVVEKEDEEEQEENMPQQQPLLSPSEDVSVAGGGNDDQHEVVDETGGQAMDSSAAEDAESSGECTPVGEQCADENEAGEMLPGKGSADGIVDEEKNALGDAEPAVSVKDEEAVCASSSDEDLLLCSSSVSDQTSSVLADFNMFNFGSTPSMTVDPNTPLFTIPIATTAVAADIPAPEPAQQTEQTDQAEDNERSVLANVVSPPPHATDKTGSPHASPSLDTSRPSSPASYRSRGRARRGSLANALARESSRQAETKLQSVLSDQHRQSPQQPPLQQPLPATAPSTVQPARESTNVTDSKPGNQQVPEQRRAETARTLRLGGLQRQPSRILNGLSRRMQSVRHTTSMVLRRSTRPIFAPRQERSIDNLRPATAGAVISGNAQGDLPPRYLVSEESDKNACASAMDHDGLDGKMSVEVAALNRRRNKNVVASTAVTRAGMGTLTGRLNTLKRSTSVVVRNSVTRAKSLFVPKRSPGVTV